MTYDAADAFRHEAHSPARRLMAALDAERALADKMAEALRAVRSESSALSDDVRAKVLSALAAYDETHD